MATTTPSDAVDRARKFIGAGTYVLGTGGYRLRAGAVDDPDPWTPHPKNLDSGPYCDCWGLVSWAFRQRRHRPNYNAGGSVVGDINVDSAIEDAYGIGRAEPRSELWRAIERQQCAIGDLIAWPSIRDASGKRIRIGHVGIVADLNRNTMRVIQCSSQSPIGCAIRETDASAWIERNKFRGNSNAKWATRYMRAVNHAAG